MQLRLTHSTAALLIILLSLAVYINSVSGGFVWDDHFILVENATIRDIKNIPHFFKGDIWKISNNPPSPYYRPVINTVWALEYQLWGENPLGYHVFNIIAHALLCLVLYFLFFKILGRAPPALISALLFAAHPIHSENVAWVNGGGYMVCSLFLVLSFLFYIRSSEKNGALNSIPASLFYMGAVLTHESALMFPAIPVAYEFLIRKRLVSIKLLLPYVLIVIAFWSIRTALDVPLDAPDVSLISRLLTSAVIIAKYLQAFFWPYSLKVLFDLVPVSKFFTAEVIVSLALVVVVASLAVFLYKKEKKAFFGLFWFLLFFFPAANIAVILKPQMMALRFIYIPSIGLAMLCGIYLDKLQPKLKIVIVLILLLFAVKTFAQNQVWQNDITLNEKMVRDAPDSVLARNNLGVAYLHAGMLDRGQVEFQKAFELDPENSFAAYNLGNTFQKLGRFDEAIPYLKKAIVLNPSYSRAFNSLGMIFQQTGRHEDAIRVYTQAVRINPANYLAHYNLATVLSMKKRDKEAISHYIQFMKIAPASFAARKASVRRILQSKGLAIQ